MNIHTLDKLNRARKLYWIWDSADFRKGTIRFCVNEPRPLKSADVFAQWRNPTLDEVVSMNSEAWNWLREQERVRTPAVIADSYRRVERMPFRHMRMSREAVDFEKHGLFGTPRQLPAPKPGE